ASIRRLANRVADIVPLTVEALTTLEPTDIALAGVPESIDDVDASRRRLTVACPGCAKPLRFGAATLGKKVSCKQCRHEFQLDWGEPAAS
ncbi:MAG TPA: hypothetical protein VGX76_04545, partial [Pirellulales bacterium]|nr:hypothetical protein [Pirellulales bacterium]